MSDVVTLKIEGMDDILAMLDDKRVRAGLHSGMRRVGSRIKTAISQDIRGRYNIKKADLDKRFNVSISDEMTEVTISGKHLSLINFVNPSSLKMRSVRPQRIGSKISKQGTILKPYVQVKILKEGGYKTLNHAFIVSTHKGGFGVFERTSKKRLPIKLLYGPSVSQMAMSETVQTRLQKIIHEDATRILRHAVAWKTNGDIGEL